MTGFPAILNEFQKRYAFGGNSRNPNIGVFQDHLIWGEMFEFTSDCVLMVLASELYDRMDYIFNYDEFLEAMIT